MFSKSASGRRGYAAADVNTFLDRLEIELTLRAGQHPVAYPGASGSQHPGATAAVPQLAVSGEPGFDNRTQSRRRGLTKTIGQGLIDLIFVFFRSEGDSRSYPHWMVPVFGALGVLIGVVSGGGVALWGGIAMLVSSAIYLGFKLVRKLVPPVQPRDDQSPPGRQSAR